MRPLRLMSHVGWSVCVSVLGTWVSCAQTSKPIEMPFGGLLLWVQETMYYINQPILFKKGRDRPLTLICMKYMQKQCKIRMYIEYNTHNTVYTQHKIWTQDRTNSFAAARGWQVGDAAFCRITFFACSKPVRCWVRMRIAARVPDTAVARHKRLRIDEGRRATVDGLRPLTGTVGAVCQLDVFCLWSCARRGPGRDAFLVILHLID